MLIKSISLKNFRNYEDETVAFCDGLNIIHGENAAGKTNLLEAVYFCALGKSERTTKDKDLVRWGAEHATVVIVLEKKFKTHTIELDIDKLGKKRIRINKIPVTKIGELVGFLNIIYFSPAELKMIKDAPGDRRRFMDITLSQQKKSYFYALTRYNKILSQRNKSLKTYKNPDSIKQILPVWDTQLAKEAAIIIHDRYALIESLKNFADIKHSILTDGKEKLELGYDSDVDFVDTAEIEKQVLEKLTAAYEKDIYLGFTTTGPQRDDLSIKINGNDVKKFGSQGQQRTAALSLKLAETFLFQQQTGEKPVILLDDVLSELDESRREKLLLDTNNFQTLITTTDALNQGLHINIKNGSVLR